MAGLDTPDHNQDPDIACFGIQHGEFPAEEKYQIFFSMAEHIMIMVIITVELTMQVQTAHLLKPHGGMYGCHFVPAR